MKRQVMFAALGAATMLGGPLASAQQELNFDAYREMLADGNPARSESQSNGALMRVSPIGVLAAGDPALAARLASADARLTHPHPVCQAASAAYAAAIATGVAGGSAEEMCSAAEIHAGDDTGAQSVRERLALARHREQMQSMASWILLSAVCRASSAIGHRLRSQ